MTTLITEYDAEKHDLNITYLGKASPKVADVIFGGSIADHDLSDKALILIWSTGGTTDP